MKFVDEVEVIISSGKGGPGCMSFRRETGTPRGGPDGGDGGKGGDLIIRSTTHLNSLLDFRQNKKYAAQNGFPGEGALCSGRNGEDLILQVPDGTLIRDEDGQIIADIGPGDEVTLLVGGRGGKGNTFFKNSVNQAPTYFQPGEPGQELRIKMELKLIADVGIIGFPSAGKSTLISRISAAKPKIADYPFTTLVPNLGVVRIDENYSIVVADTPGLIEGAHEGSGLGIQFLKHIERTRVFVHMIDPSQFSGRDPLNDYRVIRQELQRYDEARSEKDGFEPLAPRPEIVVLNKIDLIDPQELLQLQARFQKTFGCLPLLASAATGRGLDELKAAMAKVAFQHHQESAEL